MRRSPFHEAEQRHSPRGYTVYNHMLFPTHYDDFEAEYWHLLKHVTLWDVAVERCLEISGRDVLFDVQCDAGTYIRSLCVDIGDALAVGAHLQDLRRTRAGMLTESMAVTLQHLRDAVEEQKAGDESHLRSMIHPKEVLFGQMPKIEVKDSAVDAICHGAGLAVPGIVALDDNIAKGDTVVVLTMSGESVGIGTAHMSSEEIMKRSEGIAVDVSRVLMPTGTYTAAWKSSKSQDQQK